MSDTLRPQTPIDALAEEWLDTLVDLDPVTGTYIGRTDGDDRYGDYSPAGHEASAAAARSVLDRLAPLEPEDDVDRVTKADLMSELELGLELYDAGWHLRDVNVIESPAQQIRQVYDLMPQQTEADWRNIAARLAAVPAALDGYTATLREGIQRGIVPAVRQVHAVAEQTRSFAAAGGFFDELVDGAPVSGALHRELVDGAAAAREAYARLSRFFDGVLAPRAGSADGVGRELYALHSRRFLGAAVDLDETYEWGLEELARVTDEQERVAREILPGATVEEAVAHLEGDVARKLVGTDALRAWMQETADRAVAELGESHFDIPEPVRRIECMIDRKSVV